MKSGANKSLQDVLNNKPDNYTTQNKTKPENGLLLMCAYRVYVCVCVVLYIILIYSKPNVKSVNLFGELK